MACTVKVTVPTPVPAAAPAMAIHGAVGIDAHAQFGLVVTVVPPVPPLPGNEAAAGESA